MKNIYESVEMKLILIEEVVRTSGGMDGKDDSIGGNDNSGGVDLPTIPFL